MQPDEESTWSMSAPLTEVEAAAILALPKSIDTPVIWVHKADRLWAEATLPIRQPRGDINLSLKITINLRTREKFSVTLLLNGSLRVRGLCHGGSHDNRHTDRNQWRHQAHEHRWTDRCHGSWACSVNSEPDLYKALLGFCQRSGIRFAGQWSDPPGLLQLGLEDE